MAREDEYLSSQLFPVDAAGRIEESRLEAQEVLRTSRFEAGVMGHGPKGGCSLDQPQCQSAATGAIQIRQPFAW